MSKLIMIQGTHSNAGKSVLVTALCRILAQDGLRVAPFKAQNMSLNAGVTPEGGEIGRAQITQAEAAKILPHTDMNPVLLKPEGEGISQVVLNGKVAGKIEAGNYFSSKQDYWPFVTEALDRLREEYDVVVMEGAGSPAEINLKAGDIVNMRVAKYVNAPVLLVGDIDRGGVFAALVGTMVLLEPEERQLVKGFLINKFRGDISLLGDGLKMLQAAAFDVPTLGVIPFLPNLGIAEEDSVALDDLSAFNPEKVDELTKVAIIRLPHISNYDEFDALVHENGVSVNFIDSPEKICEYDAVIFPGSKMTILDLEWVFDRGFETPIMKYILNGGSVVGLCGGYQMLGRQIKDEVGIEAKQGTIIKGLGVLPLTTVFDRKKKTVRSQGAVCSSDGWLKEIKGIMVNGYQIHAGYTELENHSQSLLKIDGTLDGVVSKSGRVWGCYLHGIFENDDFRYAWLRSLGWTASGKKHERDVAYNRLADHVRSHINITRLYELLEHGG